MSKKSARIQDHFAELTDPRRRKVIYPLINVVVIAVCAVVSGADDFVAIARFGRTKRSWLARFLDLEKGIPSHDRFNAILAAIKPAEFEKCLLSWITALHEIASGGPARSFALAHAQGDRDRHQQHAWTSTCLRNQFSTAFSRARFVSTAESYL